MVEMHHILDRDESICEKSSKAPSETFGDSATDAPWELPAEAHAQARVGQEATATVTLPEDDTAGKSAASSWIPTQ